MSNPVKMFSELLASPLGELIASIGKGVGEAQAALDEGSIRQTLELYKIDNEDNKPDEEKKLMQLIRNIGYQPTFYTLPETECEAQVSLSLDLKKESKSPFNNAVVSRYAMMATPINAGNVNQYGLTANAIAKIKFKIVPVPPPSGISERRIMPNLVGRHFNEETEELILSIGLNYILDSDSQKLVDENPSIVYKISAQNISQHTVVEVGTVVNLKVE